MGMYVLRIQYVRAALAKPRPKKEKRTLQSARGVMLTRCAAATAWAMLDKNLNNKRIFPKCYPLIGRYDHLRTQDLIVAVVCTNNGINKSKTKASSSTNKEPSKAVEGVIGGAAAGPGSSGDPTTRRLRLPCVGASSSAVGTWTLPLPREATATGDTVGAGGVKVVPAADLCGTDLKGIGDVAVGGAEKRGELDGEAAAKDHRTAGGAGAIVRGRPSSCLGPKLGLPNMCAVFAVVGVAVVGINVATVDIAGAAGVTFVAGAAVGWELGLVVPHSA